MGQAEAEAGGPPPEASEQSEQSEQSEERDGHDELVEVEVPAGDDATPQPESDAQPEPEPEPDPVLVRLDELAAAVGRLDERLAERDRLAARDRDLVDRLHAENQRLRAGELFAAIAPVARDLVRLRDQLLQLDAASHDPGKSDAALIEPQLLGILARLGVEPYAPAEGDTFDGSRHQGVGRTKTDDASLDGRVATVRREGFTAPDGGLLRAAEVEVWHHVPTDPDPPGGT